MGWSSSQGRPRDLPADRTRLRGPRVDAAARLAWLLRISRLAGSPRTTRAFTQALAAQGCKLAPSALSRYETGAAPPTPELIAAYEQALDLPAGHLLGVCLGVDRMFGPTLATSRYRPRPSRHELAALLRTTETRIEAGTVTGMDWLTLARAVCRPGGVLLPPSVLHAWVANLVCQTMRAVAHAYTTRIQALSLLVTDPHTRHAVFEQVEHATSQPGAQAVIDVLAVLGETTDPVILAWLIRHLAEDTGQRQHGIAKALLTPVTRGTLPAGLVPALTDAIQTAAGGGPERGLAAFWLAQRLSPHLTREVTTTIGRPLAPVEDGARVHSPARLHRYLDAAGQASGLVDPMLERLLREGLSPDFIERRHHALLLLTFSPYRDVLATTAADLLDDTTSYAAEAAGTALTYLAGPTHRDRVLTRLACTNTGQCPNLLIALAHSGGVPEHLDLLGRAADTGQGSAAVYAAGMSGHPDLARIATTPALAGSPAQASARWWQHTGTAITDAPGQHAKPSPRPTGQQTSNHTHR